MTRLQHWMTRHCKDDVQVARAVRRSRSQISRIRRGKCSTTKRTALRLEKLTGIRWWLLMDGR